MSERMEIIAWLAFILFSILVGFAYYRTCKNTADELMQTLKKKEQENEQTGTKRNHC